MRSQLFVKDQIVLIVVPLIAKGMQWNQPLSDNLINQDLTIVSTWKGNTAQTFHHTESLSFFWLLFYQNCGGGGSCWGTGLRSRSFLVQQCEQKCVLVTREVPEHLQCTARYQTHKFLWSAMNWQAIPHPYVSPPCDPRLGRLPAYINK